MSGIPWAILLALLQKGAPPPAAPASLRELVAKSDLIAWVQVQDLRTIDLRSNPNVGSPHLADFAELRIESTVLGAGEATLVLARVGDAEAPSSAAAIGARALAFLARDGSGMWHLRPGGVWRTSPDGERLLRPVLAPPRPLGDGRSVPRALFAAELELALDLELPRLEISHITTGPSPYTLYIPADGSVRGTYTARLEGDALRGLWAAVESERFLELPESVGVPSRQTCAAVDHLTLVTRRSRHRVWIQAGRLEGLAPGELRDATERALRLWDVVGALDIPARRKR